MRDYITLVRGEEPINKQYNADADGSITKEPAGMVYNHVACTVEVRGMDSLRTSGGKSLRTRPPSLSWATFLTPSTAPLIAWYPERCWPSWAASKATGRTTRRAWSAGPNLHQLHQQQLDDAGIRPRAAHAEGTGLRDPRRLVGGHVRLAAGTEEHRRRVHYQLQREGIANGEPIGKGGYHAFVQVEVPGDIKRFYNDLGIGALDTTYGFMRQLLHSSGLNAGKPTGALRPWGIFDPCVYAPERLVYEGAPTIDGPG